MNNKILAGLKCKCGKRGNLYRKGGRYWCGDCLWAKVERLQIRVVNNDRLRAIIAELKADVERLRKRNKWGGF